MFDSNYLTTSAVEVVRQYMNGHRTLSEAIADLATRDNLNSEQTARVVEVVNQVAYLKLQQDAEDKTFEFKLADLPEVLHLMAASDGHVDYAVNTSTISPLNLFEDDRVKEASEDRLSTMSDAERHSLIHREFIHLTKTMEKLACEERELIIKLSSTLITCRKDEDILEKIAYLTDDDADTIERASKMLLGFTKKASCNHMFYEEDLGDAKRLLELTENAYSLQEKKAEATSAWNKAGNYLKSMNRGLINTKDRFKQGLPGRMGIAFTAPFVETKTPVWGSLQRVAE